MDKKIKQAVQQLDNAVKIDENWMKASKSFLLSQIEKPEKRNVFSWLAVADWLVPPRLVVRPAAVLSLVMGLLLVSSFATVNASQNTLPGNPLYELKLAAEKVRYVLAFSEEARTRASLEVAKKRAQEFVMLASRMSTESSDEEKTTVKHVSWQIKDELNNVKQKLDNIKNQLDVDRAVAVAKEIDLSLNYIQNEIEKGNLEEKQIEDSSKDLLWQTQQVKMAALEVLVENHQSQEFALSIDDLAKSLQEQIITLEQQMVDFSEVGDENENVPETFKVVEQIEMARESLANNDLRLAIEQIAFGQNLFKEIAIQADGVNDLVAGETAEIIELAENDGQSATSSLAQDLMGETNTSTRLTNPYYSNEVWLLDSQKKQEKIQEFEVEIKNKY